MQGFRNPQPLVVRRCLSVEGEPLVAVGDEVGPDTPLLSMATFPGRVLRSPVSAELRVPPADAELCMLRRPGEMVREGDVIARSSMFWNHRVARSTQEGSIAGVSASLGVVYVREHIPTQVAETVKINIVTELKGDKNHFSNYVRVKDGDKVEKGQVIATRQSGTHFLNVISPVFGTVAHVAPLLGTLSIIPDTVSSVLTAHVPGVVAAVEAGREVTLIGYGVSVDGLLGIGGEAYGRLVLGGDLPAPWRPGAGGAGGAGGADLQGAVLAAGRVDAGSLQAAVQLGVAGVVAGHMHERDICDFAGRELGVIATGDEDVPLVLVVTEGFGPGSMSAGLYALLEGYAGHTVSVSGATHIRAGVIRPRAIVSVRPPEGFKQQVLAGRFGLGEQRDRAPLPPRHPDVEVEPGMSVRVLRGPHQGLSGVVVELPEALHQVESGSLVPVARVELAGPDGRTREALVPRSNLRAEVQG